MYASTPQARGVPSPCDARDPFLGDANGCSRRRVRLARHSEANARTQQIDLRARRSCPPGHSRCRGYITRAEFRATSAWPFISARDTVRVFRVSSDGAYARTPASMSTFFGALRGAVGAEGSVVPVRRVDRIALA